MQSVITTPHLVSHIFATPLRDHDHATYHHAHHVTPSVSDSDVGTPSLLDTTRHHNRPSPTSKKRGGLRRPFVIPSSFASLFEVVDTERRQSNPKSKVKSQVEKVEAHFIQAVVATNRVGPHGPTEHRWTNETVYYYNRIHKNSLMKARLIYPLSGIPKIGPVVGFLPSGALRKVEK